MLDSIVTRFGLPAVFVGSGVEGEPFALAGGLLAHDGTVPLWAAIGAAITGSFAVDLFWFVLGRRFRSHRWVRAATDRPGFARSLRIIEHYSWLAIPLFRFAYGLRAVAPVAMGTSNIPARRFVLLGFAAAVVWGVLFTLVGYLFGAVVGPWAGELAVGGACLGIGILLFNLLRPEAPAKGDTQKKGRHDGRPSLGEDA